VDGCRIDGPKGDGVWGTSNAGRDPDETVKLNGSPGRADFRSERHDAGRWPANVILSPDSAVELDAQSGNLVSNGGRGRHEIATGSGAQNDNRAAYGDWGVTQGTVYGDTGGASRFFYCAKASRGERNAGLEGFEEREAAQQYGLTAGGSTPQQTPHLHRPAANVHPTVKPIDLMRWLCRLVTPPGGTVLDPFTGSGTTGVAAHLEGFDFIGCEREAEYATIARARIEWWSKFPAGTEVEKALGVAGVDRSHADAGQSSLFP
jgi:site-specific DNA-methyltransferase (adenine-specific)